MDISHVIVPDMDNIYNKKIRKICMEMETKYLERAEKDIFRLSSKLDFLISSGFPYRIFQQEVESVDLAVNFHSAILPKYRGPHSLTWALINGEKELGVSIHKINKEFDGGELLGVKKVEISDELWLDEIQQRLVLLKEQLIFEFLDDKLTKPPDIGDNIYWRKRTENDSWINWNLGFMKIYYFVRALSRVPIFARTRYNSNFFLIKKVSLKKFNSNKKFIPGTVIRRDGSIMVATGSGELMEILEYESESGSFGEGMVLH
jgi:methionyl-tRNA formyltransferase